MVSSPMACSSNSLLALSLLQVRVIFVDQQEMAEAQQGTVPDQHTPLWAALAC